MSSFATDPASSTTAIRHVPDHDVLASDSLPFALRYKPRAFALARALGGAVQVAEDLLFELAAGTGLDLAIGVHLDQWGRLANEPRGVLTNDEQYRRFVKARILANRSRGTPDDLIEILALIAAPYRKIEYVDLLPAGLVLSVYRDDWLAEPVRRRVRRMMDSIAPAGRTFELYEAIVGGWGPAPVIYTTPSGVPARVI